MSRAEDLSKTVVTSTELSSSFGSDKIGFSHANNYAVGSLGAHAKNIIFAADAPFYVKGDDLTDNAAGINAALLHVASRGGGQIILPPGTIRIGSTLDVLYSNIVLIGQGCDTSHGAGTNFNQKTLIKWTGPAGGTMIKFRTPYGPTTQRRVGMGLANVELTGESLANIGMECDSIALSTFKNIHVRHCTTTQYNFKCGVSGTDGPSGEALDLQLCNFSQMSFDARNTSYNSTTAKGWVIDGSTNANVSGNIFELLNGVYSGGTAYQLIRADNNVFTRCSGFRSSGSDEVYTWDLTGSNSASGLGSYGNTFTQIGWNATYGFRMGTSVETDSINTRVNTVLGYDEANGGGPPVVGGNSRIVSLSGKGDFNTLSRIDVSQLAANANSGISIRESGIRHDLWSQGQVLNYGGNGFQGTLKVSGNIDMVSAVGAYKCDGVQVLQTRKTGWSAATGTKTRTTFATSTVTTTQLAERVAALIDDLTSHGLIGS